MIPLYGTVSGITFYGNINHNVCVHVTIERITSCAIFISFLVMNGMHELHTFDIISYYVKC